MIAILTATLFVFCLAAVFSGMRKMRPEGFVISILAVFSVGYFGMPMIFFEYSVLQYTDRSSLEAALLMSVLFLLAVFAGYQASRGFCREQRARQGSLSALNQIFFGRPRLSFVVACASYWTYVINNTLSVYQSGGVENFIESYRSVDAIIAFVGNFGLAAMALIFAREVGGRSRAVNAILLVAYLLPIAALVSTAQRNAVLLPFIYLSAALAVTGNVRLAYRAVFGGIGVIFLLSPLLVFFRETSTVAADLSFVDSVSMFRFSEDTFMNLIQSLVDRADILYNMVFLIEHIDVAGFANAEYFSSVALKFVPGIFYAGKPIAMSSDGSITGHLSVIAWSLVRGDSSIGSLTVFGAITAYREGGWIWMMLNGFLTGVTFNVLFRAFAHGHDWKKLFYIVVFPGLCVKSVPPSFLEILTSLSGNMYIFLALVAIDLVLVELSRSRRIHKPIQPGPVLEYLGAVDAGSKGDSAKFDRP